MPSFRTDLSSIPVYTPGKPIEEVMREQGIDDIVKIASNECPDGPFPEVVAAISAAAAGINRYPDTSSRLLTAALAARLGVGAGNVLVTAGSTQVLGAAAFATGGPGRSVVFAEPSFVMYTIWSMVAGSRLVPVPLDATGTHDLDALAAAVTDDTTLVYLCNPNNPTGTHVPTAAVERFVDRLPERVLVVVDEAYAEYATAGDYTGSLPLATERDNVVTARTFSKIYGIAGVRVGYAVGRPETLHMLQRALPPFTVTSLGQAAALEALRHPHQVARRAADNARNRDRIAAELRARGVAVLPSQANFVWFEPEQDADALADKLLACGVIVRVLGPGIRVTVGSEHETDRFLAAWDEVAQ